MSVSLYRGQVDRLTSDLAQLEAKAAGERGRASKERADGLRATQSITRTTSASTVQSKQREAQRHEESAVGHDRQAAQYATQSATKRRALSEAQGRLEQAEGAERKKVALEADKRRRDDQRQLNDVVRARRTIGQGSGSAAPVGELPMRVGSAVTEQAFDGIRGPIAGAMDEEKSGLETSLVRLPAETNVDAAIEMSRALMLIPLLQQATRCRVRQRPPAKLRPLDS
jgi:hypothetical protein